MKRLVTSCFAAALVVMAACQDSGAPTSSTTTLASAFATLPVGYSEVQSTFGDSTNTDWTPAGNPGGRHAGGQNGMMCGGLGGFADLGLGFGLGRGLFLGELPGNCGYDAASGRVSCDPVTRNGLTIARSAAYADANGQTQESFDSLTTNTVNVRVDVSGTRVRRDGDTTTVQHTSDRTVTGLASGSTQRTVNGTSAGSETTVGSDSVGTFNAVRTIGDTIQGVVVPVDSSGAGYPTAGTIIRSMTVSATYAGQVPSTSSRREVVTFDGSSTASVEITEDGETRSCSLALPRGQLTCS